MHQGQWQAMMISGVPPPALSHLRPPGHPAADLSQKQAKRRPVLGGLLNEYERAA
jgi:hypothetical protein